MIALTALAAACSDPGPAAGPWALSGTAQLYGRLAHGGIRVHVAPGGRETLTDAAGRWQLSGVSDQGATLTFEADGFAAESRRLWDDGPQAPMVLYRGRAVPLPEGTKVVEVAEIPPAGLLLTTGAGTRLLVDLAAGNIGLTLPADWQPSTELEGYVIGYDPLSGGVDVPETSPEPTGFTSRGALRVGGQRQGMILARPDTPGLADTPTPRNALEVVFWRPGSPPVSFERPVLAVGPALELSPGEEAVALLLTDGWVYWQPGTEPGRLATLAPEAAAGSRALFPTSGLGNELCFTWADAEGDAIGCASPATPGELAQTRLPAVPGLQIAQATVDPPLLLWRDPATQVCRAALCVEGQWPSTEPFPCATTSLPARDAAGAAIFRDSGGQLHRLGLQGETLLGPGSRLTGQSGALAGYLAEDRWLTLLRPDGTRVTASSACAPSSQLHALRDGVLAIDPVAKRSVVLSSAGEERVFDLTSTQLRASAAPEVVSQESDEIGLAGPHGYLRLSLTTGHAASLVHRGWRFLDFAWPGEREPAAALPEIGLIQMRGRLRAVDLYTLYSEVIGEGTHAGLLHGRLWFVNERGLYVVDDPAAR